MSQLFWEVQQEHLEGAAFLFTQWAWALRSPRLSVRDVAEGVEERLLAHVDGLVLGERAVVDRLLRPALLDEGADPEVTWVAAYALLEGGQEGAADEVVKALAEALESAPERVAALGRALELTAAPVDERLRPLLDSPSPLVAAAALRALAARGTAFGAKLDDFIASPSPELAAAALGVAWKDPNHTTHELVERAMASGEAAVREAALRAGLLMRMRSAWDACARAVAERRDSEISLAALAMGGDARDVEQVEALLSDEALRPTALFALGFSGRARAVDACLPWLGDKKAGPLAGEVFSSITGEAIDGPLEGEPPAEEEEEDAAEKDLGADLVGGPEEELPVPDAEQVKAAWEKRKEAKEALRPELRYLGGEPVSAGRLAFAIANGPTRRRPLLALELAIRTGSASLELTGWARRQLSAPPAPSRKFEERPFEAFFGR